MSEKPPKSRKPVDLTPMVVKMMQGAKERAALSEQRAQEEAKRREDKEHARMQEMLRDSDFGPFEKQFRPLIKLLRVHPDDESEDVNDPQAPGGGWVEAGKFIDAKDDVAFSLRGPIVSLEVNSYSDRRHPLDVERRVFLKFFDQRVAKLLAELTTMHPAVLDKLGLPQLRNYYDGYSSNKYRTHSGVHDLEKYLDELKSEGTKREHNARRDRVYGQNG